MTAMMFKLLAEPDQRLDLSALTPHKLAGLTVIEIAALPLVTGKKALTVGDAFSVVMGDLADIRIGGSPRLDGIGAQMSSGRITVEGEAGAFAGRGMAGGELRITGAAGPFAGSVMAGGLLQIDGSAGDWLGAPGTGGMTGMRGGAIVVAGRAGDRVGDRMRRGLIAIGGDAGDFPASRMIAGTVAIAGDCGRLPGYLMRRGTLLLSGKAAAWPPSFGESGLTELTMLRVITRELKALAPGMSFEVFDDPVQRYAGDLAVLGKGEIIQPAA